MKSDPNTVNPEPNENAVDERIWSRVTACLEAAADRKASDPVVLDLREASQIADYFVILSGRSDTQVRAIAESIEQQARKHGLRPRAIEGMSHGQWVLMDFGDFVAHVFYEPVRGFYDLERLWARVPRVSLPAPVREETSMPASGS